MIDATLTAGCRDRGCGAPAAGRRAALLRAAAILWWVAAVAPAAAQQSAGGAIDPSKIEQRIDRPAERPAPVRELAVPTPVAPPAAQPGRKFVLVGADITGATVYTPADLSPLYEPYLGRAISLEEVEAITDAITRKYHADGYFLSRAVAPPQDVAFGVLRIRVIEGYVERVAFKGAAFGRPDLFDRWAARIAGERPLRLATLERYLLLMADLPGVTVRPALSERKGRDGTFVLEVDIERRRVGGFATFDNRGTTTVGPVQSYAGINLNDALGFAERTRLAVFTIPAEPEELRYAEIYHEETVTGEGTRLWFFLARSVADAGIAGTADKENSRGTRATLGLTQSVVRSREENLAFDLRLDAIDSDKNSATEVYDDRLRVVRLAIHYNVKDGWRGSNWIAAEVSKGFDVLHATDRDATLVSRTNGRSRFVKWTLDLTRRQEIGRNWAVQIAAAGQISPHTLLSPEEFAVGGRRFGRAYDPADISGSQGAAGSVELQYAPPFKAAPLASWQIYGFWDLGAVWGQGFTRNSMASAGGGVRFTLPHGISGGIEAAVPLTRSLTPGETDSHEARVFFTLGAQF